jgi:hypothetical protein
VQLVTRRQHHLPIVGDPRLAGHTLDAVEALGHDPDRLAHLLEPHAIAVVDVAPAVRDDAEIDLVVGEVRLDTPQVPRNS